MNAAGVQVKIFDKERSIYEREIAQPNENSLKTLLHDLRDMQSGINNFLTTLIERQDASGDAQIRTIRADTKDRSISSDIELDSSDEQQEEEKTEVKEREEEGVNPKKCKLSI